MKTFGIAFVMGLLGAVGASAGQISLIASFTDNDNLAVSNIGDAGDTTVVFLGNSFVLNCTGVDQSLCGGIATLSTNTLDSANPFTIDLGSDLQYVANTGWSVIRLGPSALIQTTGLYFQPSDQAGTETPGTFNFTMPTVLDSCSDSQRELNLDPGCSNLSAQGVSSPVPEPASFALMGAGLAGLGLLARRRRKQ